MLTVALVSLQKHSSIDSSVIMAGFFQFIDDGLRINISQENSCISL